MSYHKASPSPFRPIAAVSSSGSILEYRMYYLVEKGSNPFPGHLLQTLPPWNACDVPTTKVHILFEFF
jgi:hypothetical protein